MKSSRYFRCSLATRPRAQGELRFCLDPPNDGRMVRDRIVFRGWVVHRTRAVHEVVCQAAGRSRSSSARPAIFRPEVARRFSDFRNPDTAGFELELSEPAAGDFELLARLDDGRELLLDTVRLTEHHRPKLLFMHIAKTAGTSVNSYFASQYPEDLVATHVESDPRWNADPDYARRLEFVSGHIRLEQYARQLDLADYYKVTLLREPFSQLRSHLAWIRQLAEPGESARREKHPAYIRELSRRLWELDLSDAAALGGFVESLGGSALELLDNCQTRYLSQVGPGRRVGAADCQGAKRALGRFDKVGLTEALSPFLQEVAEDLAFDVPGESLRQNVAKSHYGLDSSRPEICEKVLPLVRFDLQLYRFLKDSLVAAD